jgi:endonuclease/exonuclease/phosphatase (EEP) superfamily protein YafD
MNFQNKSFVSYLSIGLMLLPALLCIFTPSALLLRSVAQYTVQIMFLYLFAGLGFLALRKTNYTWICFCCCGLLALFLRQSIDKSFMYEKENKSAAILRVAQFNSSNLEDNLDNSIEQLIKSDADIICVQELSATLDTILLRKLKAQYPYYSHIKNISYYGMALFSKIPLNKKEPLMVEEIPNLVTNITFGNEEVSLVCSYTEPPVDQPHYMLLKKHLQGVAEYIAQIKNSVVTIGNYNTVSWSNEIQDFKRARQLQDSRLGFMPTYPNNNYTIFKVPHDHIFYSEKLKCTNFQLVGSLGIMSTLQLKSYEELHPKK